MDSKFGNLQYLVLPSGATSGPRIVLDGVNGIITIYSVAGNQILTLDPAGLRLWQDIVGGGLVGSLQPDLISLIDPVTLTNFSVLPTNEGIDAQIAGRSLPRGLMASARITANVAPGTPNEQDVTGLSVTWDALSSRNYKLFCHGRGMATTIAGRTRLSIADSVNNHVAESDFDNTVLNVAEGPADVSTSALTGLSGSVTYKVRAQTLTGGGNWTFAATPEAYLEVFDVGG